jgi:hypothetical protein
MKTINQIIKELETVVGHKPNDDRKLKSCVADLKKIASVNLADKKFGQKEIKEQGHNDW